MVDKPVGQPETRSFSINGDVHHVRAPSYVSAIATHMSFAGPTPDGMMHLNFSRDVLTVAKEVATISAADGGGRQIMSLNIAPEDVKLVREEIATISMSQSDFVKLSSILSSSLAGKTG